MGGVATEARSLLQEPRGMVFAVAASRLRAQADAHGQEYSALQILPVDDIVDAVEIDSISKKKNFCMQLIMEDRSYRLCANDDDDLLRWLASIKCVLAKRRGSTGAVAMAAKGRTDEQTMSS